MPGIFLANLSTFRYSIAKQRHSDRHVYCCNGAWVCFAKNCRPGVHSTVNQDGEKTGSQLYHTLTGSHRTTPPAHCFSLTSDTTNTRLPHLTDAPCTTLSTDCIVTDNGRDVRDRNGASRGDCTLMHSS